MSDEKENMFKTSRDVMGSLPHLIVPISSTESDWIDVNVFLKGRGAWILKG